MASPFERAFNPAFQQASAAAMKSIDDERQDKRFQQRMLEQRQYDARLLADRQAYEAELLKGNRVYEQGQTDATRKLDAGILAAANNAALLKDASVAGVPFPNLLQVPFVSKTTTDNEFIRSQIALENEGRKLGASMQAAGEGVPTGFFDTDTPERRGWNTAWDANQAKGLADAAASTEVRKSAEGIRSDIDDENAKKALINASRKWASLYPGVTAPEGSDLQWYENQNGVRQKEIEVIAAKLVVDAKLLSDRALDAEKYIQEKSAFLLPEERDRIKASGKTDVERAVWLTQNLNRRFGYQIKNAFGDTINMPESWSLTPLKMPTGVTEANPTPAKLSPVKVQSPPLPPSPELKQKLEGAGFSPEASQVVTRYLGSRLEVTKDIRGEGIKVVGNEIKTLQKSLDLDKEAEKSLAKRTEIKTSPGQMGGGGTALEIPKSGLFYKYWDDEVKASAELSPKDFGVYKMERANHAVQVSQIRKRIESKEQFLNQLKNDLDLIQYPSPAPSSRGVPFMNPAGGAGGFGNIPSSLSIRSGIKESMAPPAILQKLTETPRNFLDSTPAELQEMFNKDPARLGRELRAAGIGEDLERMRGIAETKLSSGMDRLKRIWMRKDLNSNGFQNLPKIPNPNKIP